MRDKQFILSEIRRTAELNGGKPLGQRAFLTATGIAVHEWLGVHWARWGGALVEAGFEPLEWTVAVDELKIYGTLIPLIRKYGRYPTKAEILIEKRGNSQIPAPNALNFPTCVLSRSFPPVNPGPLTCPLPRRPSRPMSGRNWGRAYGV